MIHDFLDRHETIVVDDPDVGPVRSTSPTEAFEMQIADDEDGLFHREMDYKTTACGRPIPALGQHRRPQRYEGNLCTACYTPAEIARAAEFNARELEHITGEGKPLYTNGGLEQTAKDWLAEVPPRRSRPTTKKDKP
jgi:hypothetical protein